MTRAGRFVGVGLAGFVVQAGILSGLAGWGLPYPVATALAVEAAILHNFYWHERWTWVDRQADRKACRQDGRLARFLRFNGSTALVSIGGNVIFMWLFAGCLELPLLLANLLAVLSLGVLNFAAADKLVFVTNLTQPQDDPTSM